MSCNGGSHPRINTLGRMTRAESGPDLRYEMTCGGVGGGGGGGGGGTSRMYYSRRCTVNDQNSDGYWWVPACRRLTQSCILGQAGAPPSGPTRKPRSRPRKVLCPRSRKRRTGCPDAHCSPLRPGSVGVPGDPGNSLTVSLGRVPRTSPGFCPRGWP